MVEISGKRWKNEQFRWQFWVFLLVIPLITPDVGHSVFAGVGSALLPSDNHHDEPNLPPRRRPFVQITDMKGSPKSVADCAEIGDTAPP